MAGKKPTAAAIACAVELTAAHPELRTFERLNVCNLCGGTADPPQIYRECDAFDVPLPGLEHLLITCGSKTCQAQISKHPRLYADVAQGQPGYFPKLCGDCVLRKGLACTHPKLKANGGPGLIVTISGPKGIVCFGRRRGGCEPFPRTATKCEGRRTLRLVDAQQNGGA